MCSAYTQIYSWGTLVNRGPTSTTEAPPALPELSGSGGDGHPIGLLPPTTQLEGAGLACSRVLLFSPPVSLKRILSAVSVFPAWPIHPLSEQIQMWSRAAVLLGLLLPSAEGPHARELWSLISWRHQPRAEKYQRSLPFTGNFLFPFPKIVTTGHGLFIYS